MQTSFDEGGRAARRVLFVGSAVAVAVALASCGGGGGGNNNFSVTDRGNLKLTVESSAPEWVSGGDALLKLDSPPGLEPSVTVNGQTATVTVMQDPNDNRTQLLLVSGLVNGTNTIAVQEMTRSDNVVPPMQTSIQVTNYPRTGPMFSGPWETPYICQTQSFLLYPSGPNLGAATDANCSITTRVDYLYRKSTGGNLVPLPSTSAVPADAATTTTTDGRTVPFIVRLETGTINRAVYQTAVLHNPAAESTPTPVNKSSGWNGKLVYTFGGGCTGGWYRQGTGTGGVVDLGTLPILQQGYAVASSSLNVYGNNCQDVTTSESMAMVKERFIEAYGRPNYTIGWGCSGGSYQQYQIADNYPGLLDGILPGCSFPEVMFATVYSITDMRLLGNYFRNTAPATFTDDQQRRVAGVQLVQSIYTGTNYNGAMRIAPNEWIALDGSTQTYCPSVLPVSQRWSPTNTTGARCDVYDHVVNVLGRDPATGYARRPIDNVGVQYGLQELNAGRITVDQFLDMNERVGGYDVNGGFQAARTVADLEAVRRAYRTGRLTNAGGGLKDVPIIDYRAYQDEDPGGNIHLRYHSFSMRERLIKANGDADNQVMLHEDIRYGGYSSSSPLLMRALAEMDKWLAAIHADKAAGTQHQKVVRNKPSTLVEGCMTRDATNPTFIAEKMSINAGQCAQLYPAPAAPRAVAGAPIAHDIIKCTLKPVTMTDYAVAFSGAQQTRLNTIFAGGVCNYAVPGVEQQGLMGTWLKF